MKKKSIIGLAITIVVITAFVVGVISFGPDTNNIEELEAVEVREYQGENLSSINDFRENSIKGPQYIDIDNYQLKVSGLVEAPQGYAYDEVINNYEHYQKVSGWTAWRGGR